MKDKELRKLIGSRAKQRRLELNLAKYSKINYHFDGKS